MAPRYGIAIDLERCIGCHACAIACKLENDLNAGSWIRVQTVGGPLMDTPAGHYPDLSMHFLPVACMHCSEPPCQSACPTEAIFKRADGIVLIAKESCNGCQACVQACPYDAIRMNEESNLAEKCTLCAPRLDQGLKPFCLVCCEGEAIHLVRLDQRQSEEVQLLEKRQAYVLLPEKGTEPSTHFCPPLERREV